MDMETWTWRHGYGNIKIKMLGNPDISGKNQPENRSPGDFP
jgi:hypothetical protein